MINYVKYFIGLLWIVSTIVILYFTHTSKSPAGHESIIKRDTVRIVKIDTVYRFVKLKLSSSTKTNYEVVNKYKDTNITANFTYNYIDSSIYFDYKFAKVREMFEITNLVRQKNFFEISNSYSINYMFPMNLINLSGAVNFLFPQQNFSLSAFAGATTDLKTFGWYIGVGASISFNLFIF